MVRILLKDEGQIFAYFADPGGNDRSSSAKFLCVKEVLEGGDLKVTSYEHKQVIKGWFCD